MSMGNRITAARATPSRLEVHDVRYHGGDTSPDVAGPCSSRSPILSAAVPSSRTRALAQSAALQEDADPDQHHTTLLLDTPSQPHPRTQAAQSDTLPAMHQFEIEEDVPTPFSRPAIRTLASILGNVFRTSVCTGAGRLASWTLLQAMPQDLDVAAYAIATFGSSLRCFGAINLGQKASRTVNSRALRVAATAGAFAGGSAMIAPVGLLLLHPENKRFANIIAMQSIADVAYAAVREPLQQALRHFGPRMSLPLPASRNQPHWRIMPVAGGAYALSALGLLMVSDHIGPAGCGESPVCSALATIAPTVAVEAIEAAATACIYALFRDTCFDHDYSPRLPECSPTLINACLSVFATGVMRLLELWRQEPDGPSHVEHAILLAFMMLSLEMTAGLAQRIVARLATGELQDEDDRASVTTESTVAEFRHAPDERASS